MGISASYGGSNVQSSKHLVRFDVEATRLSCTQLSSNEESTSVNYGIPVERIGAATISPERMLPCVTNSATPEGLFYRC